MYRLCTRGLNDAVRISISTNSTAIFNPFYPHAVGGLDFKFCILKISKLARFCCIKLAKFNRRKIFYLFYTHAVGILNFV